MLSSEFSRSFHSFILNESKQEQRGIPLNCSYEAQLLKKGDLHFYLGCQYFFRNNHFFFLK